MKDHEQRAKFWQNMESKMNEKLVLSAVALYEGGYPGFSDTTTGLLYLMSDSLNFEDFEKTTWGFAIFGKKKFNKTEFRIPLSDIKGYKASPPEKLTLKKWWKYFTRGAPSKIVVHFLYYGRRRTIVFSNVVPFEQWEELLDKYINKKETRGSGDY